jgi:hypothetical protein
MTMSTTKASGSRFKRSAAGVALAASVAVGGLTVAAINPLASAGAQDGGTPTTTTAKPARTGANLRARVQVKDSRIVHDALASLVSDGTLTQAQADAVTARLSDTATTLRGQRRTAVATRRQDLVSTAATALGMSADDLKAELRSGKTVAQVADEQHVELQKVTDALTAEIDTAIDHAASNGTIEPARAATMKGKVATRVQTFLEHGGRRAGTGG